MQHWDYRQPLNTPKRQVSNNNAAPQHQLRNMAMAAFDTTRPVAVLNAGRITTVFTDMVATFTTWNDARITRKALTKLTMRELDDIGLTYADVDTIGRITR